MERKIRTFSMLGHLVELDETNHAIKKMAHLLLDAANNWPSGDGENITAFIADLKIYYGAPLTTEKINSVKFNGMNAWNLEAGASIIEIIKVSKSFSSESDFDTILENILTHYEKNSRLN